MTGNWAVGGLTSGRGRTRFSPVEFGPQADNSLHILRQLALPGEE